MTAKKGRTMFSSRGRAENIANDGPAEETRNAPETEEYASRIIKAAQLFYGGENWLRDLAEDLEAMTRKGGAAAGGRRRAPESALMQGAVNGRMRGAGMYPYMYGAGMYDPAILSRLRYGSALYGPAGMYGGMGMNGPETYAQAQRAGVPPMRGGVPGAAQEQGAGSENSGSRDMEVKREAELLSRAVPEFSYEEALKNNAFSAALDEGLSVLEAYTRMLEMPRNMPRDPIAQNGQTAQRGTGEVTANPAKLDTADFMKYINKIKNA